MSVLVIRGAQRPAPAEEARGGGSLQRVQLLGGVWCAEVSLEENNVKYVDRGTSALSRMPRLAGAYEPKHVG